MSDHAGTAKRSREERHQEAKKARGEEVEDEYESDIDMDEEVSVFGAYRCDDGDHVGVSSF